MKTAIFLLALAFCALPAIGQQPSTGTVAGQQSEQGKEMQKRANQALQQSRNQLQRQGNNGEAPRLTTPANVSTSTSTARTPDYGRLNKAENARGNQSVATPPRISKPSSPPPSPKTTSNKPKK